MVLPYLKLVGGIALLVIAAKLLVPEDEGDDVTAGTSLWHAIRIVVIADIVMSLDNVIAVAAAANGQLSLLILGLAVSIPMIIAGAALDHDGARPVSNSGLAGRNAARVDRGRRDRNRSGSASLHAAAARWPDCTQSRRDLGGFRRVAALQSGRRSGRIRLLGAGRDRRLGRGIDLAEAQAAAA